MAVCHTHSTMESKAMAVCGIDLGTTNSLVAVLENGRPKLIPNALGEVLTPSCVGIDDDGGVVVGQAARDRLITHPQSTTASFNPCQAESGQPFQADANVARHPWSMDARVRLERLTYIALGSRTRRQRRGRLAQAD